LAEGTRRVGLSQVKQGRVFLHTARASGSPGRWVEEEKEKEKRINC